MIIRRAKQVRVTIKFEWGTLPFTDNSIDGIFISLISEAEGPGTH